MEKGPTRGGEGKPSRSPRQVMLCFAAFFLAYAVYARFLTAQPHNTYALFSLALALMWAGLAFTWKDDARP